MKLRKLIFLPVILVALSGCELFAKPVPKEEANKQVAAAMTKSMTEKHESVDGTLGLKLDATYIEYEDVVTSPSVVNELEAALDVSFKAKDINKPTFQFAGTAEGKLSVKENNVETNMISGNTALYYDANWLYADYKVTVKEGSTAPTKTEENKVKFEVGQINLPPVEEEAGVAGEMELETMLNSVKKIKARKVGKNLVVSYEITQDDIVELLLESQIKIGEALGMTFTSEEIEAARLDLEESVKEFIEIRKAALNLVVSEAGLITKLDVVLDLDLFAKETRLNEVTGQPEGEYNTKTTIKGSVNLAVKYNQPVTITLPDFSGYVEIE